MDIRKDAHDDVCRLDAAKAAIAHAIHQFPARLVFGHGSFFRSSGMGPWGDLDIVIITSDNSPLLKIRQRILGEILDITLCGFSNIESEFLTRARLGRQDLLNSVASSKRIYGSIGEANLLIQRAAQILDVGPAPHTTNLVDQLRLRLTLRGDDRFRLTPDERAACCLEDFEALITLGLLNRGHWYVSRAYSSLWSIEAKAFGATVNQAIYFALRGSDKQWNTLVIEEIERAGGNLREWPAS